MEDPRHIHIADYQYPLPDDRIPRYPLPERDLSKLLLYRNGEIREDIFRNLPLYLPRHALLVMNNTRVIHARLLFRKPTGAAIEVFLLEPSEPRDYALSLAARGQCSWHCLVGNAKKWKEGALTMELPLPGAEGKGALLRAERMEDTADSCVVRFSWEAPVVFAEVVEAVGELPIPPYLHRKTEAHDLETYQTVYAKVEGSVAAPTAGLHFTPDVLAALDARGVTRDEVTLHVGAGTFRPVKSVEVGDHAMHSEWFGVKRSVVEQLLAFGGSCVAVGTTTVRTLESLYFLGRQLLRRPDPAEPLHVEQWEPYTDTGEAWPSTVEALEALHDYMRKAERTEVTASTRIIIAPGYRYHVVRSMITNFHQPQSTLLLLVSAFVGNDWHRIYDYALTHDFRFLSYGDSSFLNYP